MRLGLNMGIVEWRQARGGYRERRLGILGSWGRGICGVIGRRSGVA